MVVPDNFNLITQYKDFHSYEPDENREGYSCTRFGSEGRIASYVFVNRDAKQIYLAIRDDIKKKEMKYLRDYVFEIIRNL